jgi:hypothetical protein
VLAWAVVAAAAAAEHRAEPTDLPAYQGRPPRLAILALRVSQRRLRSRQAGRTQEARSARRGPLRLPGAHGVLRRSFGSGTILCRAGICGRSRGSTGRARTGRAAHSSAWSRGRRQRRDGARPAEARPRCLLRFPRVGFGGRVGQGRDRWCRRHCAHASRWAQARSVMAPRGVGTSRGVRGAVPVASWPRRCHRGGVGRRSGVRGCRLAVRSTVPVRRRTRLGLVPLRCPGPVRPGWAPPARRSAVWCETGQSGRWWDRGPWRPGRRRSYRHWDSRCRRRR